MVPIAGTDLELVLTGTTGGHRAYSIALIARLATPGMTASEGARILGSPHELREQDRAAAIQAIASTNGFGNLAGDSAALLNGTHGGHRAFAIGQIAAALRPELPAADAAAILGGNEDLREQDRTAAIRSIVEARKLKTPLTGDNLEMLLIGTSGGHRVAAISLLTRPR